MSKATRRKEFAESRKNGYRKIHSKKAIVRAAEKVDLINNQLKGIIIEMEAFMGEENLEKFIKWRENPAEENSLTGGNK